LDLLNSNAMNLISSDLSRKGFHYFPWNLKVLYPTPDLDTPSEEKEAAAGGDDKVSSPWGDDLE
jgi:hypothetical protein